MFSIPYADTPQPPYWGKINAANNFCEEDHIITTYIAEFINTLTNITYIYYAYKGIQSNSHRQDAILRNLPYIGLAGVGLLSGLYHATMKDWTQWGDDTSMLIATTTVLHRVYTYDKSLRYTVISGCTLFTIMTAFIAWHCITDELIMHSVLFGIEIAIIGLKTRSIIVSRVASVPVQKQVKKLVAYGGVIFVSGFVLWNIDNQLCSTLTVQKRAIGMPWSFFLELHGWWHVLTGIGAYIFIALVEYLTSEEAGQQLGRHFAWPVGLILNRAPIDSSVPVVEEKMKVKRNGNGNVGGKKGKKEKGKEGRVQVNGNANANGKVKVEEKELKL